MNFPLYNFKLNVLKFRAWQTRNLHLRKTLWSWTVGKKEAKEFTAIKSADLYQTMYTCCRVGRRSCDRKSLLLDKLTGCSHHFHSTFTSAIALNLCMLTQTFTSSHQLAEVKGRQTTDHPPGGAIIFLLLILLLICSRNSKRLYFCKPKPTTTTTAAAHH